MSESLQVVCPSCSAANRLPGERLGDRPTCGRCKQQLFQGHPVALTAASFDAQVGKSDLPVVVDFWAPWCGPCRSMAPHFERAAALLEPRVRLAKLDTQAEPGIAGRYRVSSIPTLIVFRGGRELARQSGAMDQAGLVAWIRQVVGIG